MQALADDEEVLNVERVPGELRLRMLDCLRDHRRLHALPKELAMANYAEVEAAVQRDGA